jgi:hypothetical protein
VRQTGFITPLRVESMDARNWCLLEDFVWNGTKGDTFIVPSGSLTDFASVPWWTQSILPRTGTWTKAAVMHDKMCDELNEIHRLRKNPQFAGIRPTFTSVDTDAIFRKNARDNGTDRVRSELLWMGVRLGALANPARRVGWLGTAPRVVGDVVLLLAFLYLITFFILWVAHGFPAIF